MSYVPNFTHHPHLATTQTSPHSNRPCSHVIVNDRDGIMIVVLWKSGRVLIENFVFEGVEFMVNSE